MTSRLSTPLSILDLATVSKDQTPRDALVGSVALAQRAEARGYRRVWYAEHHNMATIASSAPAVLIAHVAAHTSTIRLGSGGVMLPDHAPLTIAEQYGTLATLHPDRIDLGLGRAPGTDQVTLRAMRRDHTAADTFPQDVLELQGYLTGNTRIPGVDASPGKGTDVPLYVLGSSYYGAQLAAVLGLPYAFASHFAPGALHEAVAIYRAEFKPSAQLDQPYVMAGVNVITAETDDEVARNHLAMRRSRVGIIAGRGRTFTDEEADAILASPQARQIDQMMHYTAVGTPTVVADYLEHFAEVAHADELITVHQAPSLEARLRSVDLLADVVGMVAAT